MNHPRVEILIDELVLHGFSPADRHAIGEALSLELQRLVIAGGMHELAGMGDVSVLRTANIRLEAGAKPQKVGARVAQAVHGGLHSDGKRQKG